MKTTYHWVGFAPFLAAIMCDLLGMFDGNKIYFYIVLIVSSLLWYRKN
jgi:hypothetical protein